MFALKIILKYVQKTNVTDNYVSSKVVGDVGKNAMKLALKVAVDINNDMNLDYLLVDESLTQTEYATSHQKQTSQNLLPKSSTIGRVIIPTFLKFFAPEAFS